MRPWLSNYERCLRRRSTARRSRNGPGLAARIVKDVDFRSQFDPQRLGHRERDDGLVRTRVDQGQGQGIVAPWSPEPHRDLRAKDRVVRGGWRRVNARLNAVRERERHAWRPRIWTGSRMGSPSPNARAASRASSKVAALANGRLPSLVHATQSGSRRSRRPCTGAEGSTRGLDAGDRRGRPGAGDPSGLDALLIPDPPGRRFGSHYH